MVSFLDSGRLPLLGRMAASERACTDRGFGGILTDHQLISTTGVLRQDELVLGRGSLE